MKGPIIDWFDLLWELLDTEIATWFLGWTGVLTAWTLSLGRAQWLPDESRSIVLGLVVTMGGIAGTAAWMFGGAAS